MKIGPATYVPSLRWRMGEYQALSRLSGEAKARVVPFVVVPEIEFDFEEWAPKKTVQEHVEPFPKRFQQKWGNRPAWIDVHQSWLRKFEQGDKWSFCLTAGTLWPANQERP